jgi:hypothetical protein
MRHKAETKGDRMQLPTPRAVQDARDMIANPDRYQDLSGPKLARLRGYAWLILESSKGKPARQSRRIIVKPLTGGTVQ